MSKLDKLSEKECCRMIDEMDCYPDDIFEFYKAGYNRAISTAKQWIKDNYWTCSSAEEYSEEFVKFMNQ